MLVLAFKYAFISTESVPHFVTEIQSSTKVRTGTPIDLLYKYRHLSSWIHSLPMVSTKELHSNGASVSPCITIFSTDALSVVPKGVTTDTFGYFVCLMYQ